MDTSTPLDPSPAKLNAFCDSVMISGLWSEDRAKAVAQCQRRAPMAVAMRLGLRVQFPTYADCAAAVVKASAALEEATRLRFAEVD